MAGCVTAVDRGPEKFADLAHKYAGTQPAAGTAHVSRWWEQYNSAELDGLIEDAMTGNPGLHQTRKRLEQAAAIARKQLSSLLPDATITGEHDTERGSTHGPSTFALRGAAGYELDIWGKNRAGYRAKTLESEAAVEDVRTGAITLSAAIVESWLQFAALREEEALLRHQIETNAMALDLQFDRYAHGAAGALDVFQQREILARAGALLPDILADQEITRHRIAVLTGQNPSENLYLEIEKLPDALPLPDTGIPIQLLDNRPDIEAAWLRLHAADWDAEAAWAARLPSLQIDAGYSTTGTSAAKLFDLWTANLAAALALPIIDGGERRAEEKRARAEAEENLHSYRETVLTAIAEVEDALTRNHHQQDKIVAVDTQLEASRDALESAQHGYANGNTDYLSVLNGMINVQALERQMVQEKRALALDRIALYRALGMKCWTDEVIVQAQR